MYGTGRLLQSLRITLFTRQSCSLCSKAKTELSQVWEKRPFIFEEVDVIKPEFQSWRNLYEFDVPVIHISKHPSPREDPELSSKAVKLMHRFTAEQVKAKMNEVEFATSKHTQ